MSCANYMGVFFVLLFLFLRLMCFLSFEWVVWNTNVSRMSHEWVTNESRMTCVEERVMSRMDESRMSRVTYEWVVSHTWPSRVTCEWVMSRIKKSLFTDELFFSVHTAKHQSTLQHSATLCNTLQHSATLALQHSATLCNTLQHSATLYNTLQHTATHCNTLQHTTARSHNWFLSLTVYLLGELKIYQLVFTLQHTAAHCSTLQHTAVHCNTLQHTAAHCSILQQTAMHCNPLSHTSTHFNTFFSHDQFISGIPFFFSKKKLWLRAYHMYMNHIWFLLLSLLHESRSKIGIKYYFVYIPTVIHY